ncbi:MAG TPA: hypothetical protein VFU76_07880 [Terriglobales bacterium]|nr:hypothetical protein [Terriglobales bacterium]
MPQRQRPSLSAPSYGAYTGRINWSRGMDERLAAGTSYAPPVQAESASSTPVATQPRSSSVLQYGNQGNIYLKRAYGSLNPNRM